MNNETILIIGAAGNNGSATVDALVKKQLSKTKVRAAVRSAEKAKPPQNLEEGKRFPPPL